MSEKEHARGVLNFLKWVEESLAREDIKTHVKILVQSYIAKLYDEGKLGKEAHSSEAASKGVDILDKKVNDVSRAMGVQV